VTKAGAMRERERVEQVSDDAHSAEGWNDVAHRGQIIERRSVHVLEDQICSPVCKSEVEDTRNARLAELLQLSRARSELNQEVAVFLDPLVEQREPSARARFAADRFPHLRVRASINEAAHLPSVIEQRTGGIAQHGSAVSKLRAAFNGLPAGHVGATRGVSRRETMHHSWDRLRGSRARLAHMRPLKAPHPPSSNPRRCDADPRSCSSPSSCRRAPMATWWG
jgi:hypothetical protein